MHNMNALLLFLFFHFFNSLISLQLPDADNISIEEIQKINLDNFKPIIAILSIPHKKFRNSVISTDIVRFIEEGGARVLPIHYRTSWETVQTILSHINGVVFQGGGPKNWPQSEVTIHFNLQWKIFKWVLEENQKGRYFPILGICLGYQRLFQFVSLMESGQNNFQAKSSDEVYNIRNQHFGVQKVDSEYHAANLELLTNNSVLFNSTYELIKSYSINDTKKLFFLNNKLGLTEHSIKNPEVFKKNWKLIAKTEDYNGTWFAAAIEHKKYPFFGLQLHPEKIQFDSYDHLKKISKTSHLNYIPSSEEAIEVNSKISMNFVKECKKNKNRFIDSNDYEPKLIDNYRTYIHRGGDISSYYGIYKGFKRFNDMETVLPDLKKQTLYKLKFKKQKILS